MTPRMTIRATGTAALVAAAAWIVTARGEAPSADPGPKGPGLAGFEGSPLCQSCHPSEHASWEGSQHARSVRPPGEKDRDLLSRSILCADRDPVLVLGERHARRYMVPSPHEQGKHVLLPCRWDVAEAAWSHLHEDDWDRLTWERGCAACHTTGFSSDSLDYHEAGIGCEACHGPGSRHGTYEDRGGMIAFAALPAAREVTLCGSCHLQGGTSRSTGLNFPKNYLAGDDLFADYRFDWSLLNAGAQESGNPIDIHQKILIRDHVAREGEGGSGLRCTSCHAIHGNGHEKHVSVGREEYCHLCHEKDGFQLKEYSQACNVCEF